MSVDEWGVPTTEESRISDASLDPSSVTLSPGDTVRFDVQFTDDAGKPVKGPVLWSATGGTIDKWGLYTAGSEAGDFHVIGEARVTGAADTAQVEVRETAEPLSEPEEPPAEEEDSDSGDDTDDGSKDDGSNDDGSKDDGSKDDGSGDDGSGDDGSTDDPVDYDVAISPGQSIQAAVDANPTGTVFLIKSGTHRRQEVKPKDRQQFVGEDGAVMDGEHVAQRAFGSAASDVEIRNLEITRYRADNSPRGAIGVWNGTGWRLIDLVVTHSLADGVQGRGFAEIRGGSYSWNGRTGISLTQGSNVVIDGVELAHNHHEQAFHGSGIWHNGGIKVTDWTGLTIRNSHAHSNEGAGLWCDIDCRDVEFSGNLVEDNTWAGIFYEISTQATISGNTIRNNGSGAGSGYHGSGILVASSSHVRVEGNTLRGNRDGIIGLQKARGNFRVTGLRVLANDISGTARGSGLRDHDGDGRVFSDDNFFDRNSYTNLKDKPFHAPGGLRAWKDWRALGQDPNSTLN